MDMTWLLYLMANRKQKLKLCQFILKNLGKGNKSN